MVASTSNGMIVSTRYIILINDLKRALQSGHEMEVERIENNLWGTVQATKVRFEDGKAIMEIVGLVAITLREGGAFRLALRWYKQLCDFSGAFEPWSEDTAWDYCHYAECLVEVGDREQADDQIYNAEVVTEVSDVANTKLLEKIEALRKRYTEMISATD